MGRTLTILVAGNDRAQIESLAARVRATGGCSVTLRHMANGNADVLHGLATLPELLVLQVGATWADYLGALCRRPPAGRPPTLVVGPAGATDAMRMAMQAGARDYLPLPVEEADLLGALERVRDETQRSGRGARWTLFMNARGGSGASFVACNVAHMMTMAGGHKVALVDLDVQFGTLAAYLDLEPRHGLLDALDAVHEMDQVALEGYMEKYDERLHLLAGSSRRVVLPEELPVAALESLCELMSAHYDHVVVDAPRVLNHFTASAIERAQTLVLVMQQSVPGLQETLRLVNLLRSEVSVSADRIRVLVNRYQKQLAVGSAHIEKTLGGEVDVVLLPNDFRSVTESVDSGTPMYRHAPGSSVTKGLLKLQRDLCEQPVEATRSLFARSLAHLFGAS